MAGCERYSADDKNASMFHPSVQGAILTSKRQILKQREEPSKSYPESEINNKDSVRESINPEESRIPPSCGWDLKGADAQEHPEYSESTATAKNSAECHKPQSVHVHLKRKLQEQEERIRGQEQMIEEQEQKIREQEQRIREQEQKIREQEQNIREMKQKAVEKECKIGEGEYKIEEQEQKIREQEKRIWGQEQRIRAQEWRISDQKQRLREQEDVIRKHEQKSGEREHVIGEQEQKIEKQEEKIEKQKEKIGEQKQKVREQELKIREQEEVIKEQKQKIRRQEKGMRLQEEQIRGHIQKQELLEISPMEDIALRYDGRCNQLIREYDVLMTNPDGILGHLEDELKNSLDADVVLGSIVMAAYEECKKHVLDLVGKRLQRLFTVQNEETEYTREMDDISRAFDLLLPAATNQKSQLASSITSICERIKEKMQELAPYKRAKRKVERFPTEKVVELTWKLVTIPNPVIVCQPMEFDPRIHNCEPECWNVKQQKPYQLFYVRPVVYRSYHGSVASKGLVGNVIKS